MIKHVPFQQLGKANHGWLQANHHFSFAQYYDPQRMGFGKLRVINDDLISPNSGFPTHPHSNMEIITYVRSGAVSHEDSMGNKGITRAGEVQVMSAGTGIQHAEFNHSPDPLTLFQIWIEPNKQNVIPRWDSRTFPQDPSEQHLPLLVSGFSEDKDNALFIHQNARIYGGQLTKDTSIKQTIHNQAYVLVSKGEVQLSIDNQKVTLEKGDGAEITLEPNVQISALSDAEVLVLDVPADQ